MVASEIDRLDVNLMLALREHLSSEMPLLTLERVLANLKKAKELPEGGGSGMGVEALSIISRIEGGLGPFKNGSDEGKPRIANQ